MGWNWSLRVNVRVGRLGRVHMMGRCEFCVVLGIAKTGVFVIVARRKPFSFLF